MHSMRLHYQYSVEVLHARKCAKSLLLRTVNITVCQSPSSLIVSVRLPFRRTSCVSLHFSIFLLSFILYDAQIPIRIGCEKNMSQIDKVNFCEFGLASVEHFDDDLTTATATPTDDEYADTYRARLTSIGPRITQSA